MLNDTFISDLFNLEARVSVPQSKNRVKYQKNKCFKKINLNHKFKVHIFKLKVMYICMILFN